MGNGFLPPEQPAVKVPVVAEASAQNADELSSVEQDERVYEQLEQEAEREHFLEVENPVAPVVASSPGSSGSRALPQDEITMHIEQILEEGLEKYFSHLPAEAQGPFRKKGQEVAGELAIMVRVFRLKVRRAVLLIRSWLMTIPGVNAFFLEQEAKIKTDRLLAYQDELRKNSNPQP